MLFFILAAILAITMYFYFTWNNRYWENRGIPAEKPKFFFGNFKDALTSTKHFGVIYVDLYKKFNNCAYFGFYKLKAPTIILRDLDLIKDVMIKDFNSFADNDFHIDEEVNPTLAANPFFLTDEKWKTTRYQWSSSMTTSKIKMMHDSMNEIAKKMVDYLNNHIKNNPSKDLEARELALKYLTDVIVTSVLGLQNDSFNDKDNVFKKIASSLFVSNFFDAIVFMSFMILPWLSKILRLRFISKEMEKELLEISHSIVSNRQKNGFMPNDFFKIVMDKGGSSKEIDYTEISGRAFGFLSEGIETSSGLISFTLYELAANPDVQSRLRDELDDAADNNGGKLSYEQIQELPYYNMVISEVLRYHPPAFAFHRLCTKEYTLPPPVEGGNPFTVPVGMPVVIPAYAIHMDPQYYPDPDRFDPERFTEEAIVSRPKLAFMPFGDGPRLCVGTRLALAQTKIGIATIVQNFELKLSPRMKPGPIDIDPNVLLMRAVGDLWITIHPRPETSK